MPHCAVPRLKTGTAGGCEGRTPCRLTPAALHSAAGVFEAMAGARQHLEVLDWGIANATLEEVFIRFAKNMGERNGGWTRAWGPQRGNRVRAGVQLVCAWCMTTGFAVGRATVGGGSVAESARPVFLDGPAPALPTLHVQAWRRVPSRACASLFFWRRPAQPSHRCPCIELELPDVAPDQRCGRCSLCLTYF